MASCDNGLQGAPNFRDLGGYRSSDGRVVRHGEVYRSESLTYLTEADLVALRGLGIGLVIDVRSAHERRAQPSRLPQGYAVETLVCDVDADLRACNQPLIAILRANPTPDGARELLRQTYARLPGAFAGRLGDFFAALARTACPPAVLHCTVGKDRTGFVAAMLLFALGVPRDAVLDDYLATGTRMRNPRLAQTIVEILGPQIGAEPDAETIDALLGVDSEYFETALATIDEDYGSLEHYLATAGGLDAPLRRALKARLLQ